MDNTTFDKIDINTLLGLIPYLFSIIKKGYDRLIIKIKYHGFSDNARNIASAIHSYSWINLQHEKPSINRIGYIETLITDKIFQFWQTNDTPILLHGPAGSGKSWVALNLAQKLTNEGYPVLYILATDFPQNSDPVTILENRLPLKSGLVESLVELSKEKTCVAIIDQLDSVSGTTLGKNFCSFAKSLAGNPNIKILVVSRTFEYLNDNHISNLCFYPFECKKLSQDETANYLSMLGLKNPSSQLLELGNNLLNLSLVASITETFHGNLNLILNETALWEKYFSAFTKQEGYDISTFVLDLAFDTSKQEKRVFPVHFSKNTYRRRLLSQEFLVEVYGRNYSFRHEQLQDFLGAYALLKGQPNLEALFKIFGEKIPKGVLLWLHKLYYQHDVDKDITLINDVLSARKKLPFYSRAVILEDIRDINEPNEKLSKEIQKHLADQNYQKFFFQNLEDATWIVPLYKAGYFYEIPDLLEEPPGSFRALDWYAGRYLLRFADQFEDIIVDVIQKANTENWIVQELLIDCMLKISPDKVSMFLPKIESWLNGRFAQMLPYKLEALSKFFIESNHYQEAIKMLEFITSPIIELKSGESSKYFPPFKFRADRYWVNEFIEKQYHKLVQTDPRGVLDVYKRHLGKAIEIVKEIYPDDAEERVGYYWRLEISNKFSEHSEDILDILIDGLRDSILELCSQFKPESKDIIDQFYSSEHIIFRRIALYVLRINGKDFPELVTKIFLEYDLLHSDEFRRDYTGLLRDQFGTISPESRKTVTDFILKGPRDVEQRANRNAQRENHEVTDKDRQIVQDQWKQYYLEIVKDFLSEEMLIYLNHLDEIYGKTDITETPLVVTSSWGSAPSPLSNEGISSMSFDELQQYFISYMPDDLFLNPRESLGRIFQQLVSEKPSFYLEFAPFLNNPEMRFVYIYHYIFGLREGIKKENIHLDDNLLSLCKYIVQSENDPFITTAGDHEPGLITAKREVASLIEQSLRSDDPYLSRSQLDLIRDMLIMLCHHSDPEIEDEKAFTFDPFTRSFNCVRGIAMHGIFRYSLYIVRQMEKKENTKLEAGFLEPQIRDLLEEKLDKQNDPSPAVHSVYGCFLTQLHYLSQSWLITNLSAIFPQGEENYKYWKAAWDAYIISSNVYSTIVELIIPQYQKSLLALREPSDKIEYWENSPTERLAQHIFLIYLRNITDFDHSNQLIDLFFRNADDATRAQGVFWLSQVLENEKPSIDDPLWGKCWVLWQRRIDYVETQEPSQNSQEISEYLRWLKSCPLGMEILFPVLQKSIKYLHDSYDCMLVTEYAATQSENFPFESVTLLQMVILSKKEPWWRVEDKYKEKILKNAVTSHDTKTKEIAIEIINFLGENEGEYHWRNLLP